MQAPRLLFQTTVWTKVGARRLIPPLWFSVSQLSFLS